MRRVTMLLALVGLLLIQAGSAGAVTLYDDFGTGYIKKSMWLDHDFGSLVNEKVREIDTANDVLVLKLGTNSQKYPSRHGIRAIGPFDLTSIEADVKVVEMNNDPTDSGTVFARVAGHFYNTQSATASELTGNVWAELCIGDKGNGLEAWFEIEEFTGPTNDDARLLIQKNIAEGTTLSLDTFYTLEISYNGDNVLTFTISDGTTELESVSTDELTTELPTGLPAWVGAPFGDIAHVQVAVLDDPDEFVDGYVHAEVDSVSINDGAITDIFDGTRIDLAKWIGREYVRESINGNARLHVRGEDSTTTSRLFLRDRFTDYIEATARIEGQSTVENGAFGRVRIGGYFYNLLHGPGNYNGYEGDVWVQLALQINTGGSMEAKALLYWSNVDKSSFTLVEEIDMDTPILPDTDYVLSINFTGTGFEFTIDDETKTYTITTTVNDPSDSARATGSRLYLSPGQTGFLKGRIDNVRVSDPDYTNLGGSWTLTKTNSQASGGCSPEEDETSTGTVTQTGCKIVTEDDNFGGRTVGVISGSRLLLEGSMAEGGEFAVMTVDMTLSDENTATGTVTIDVTDGCQIVNDLSLDRSVTTSDSNGDGGGSGCYIKSLLF